MVRRSLCFYSPSEFEISATLKVSMNADITDALEEALPVIRAVGTQKAADNFAGFCLNFYNAEISDDSEETIFFDETENIREIYERLIGEIDNEKIYRLNLDSLTLKKPDDEIIKLPRWENDCTIKITAETISAKNPVRNSFPAKRLIDLIYHNPFFEIERIHSYSELKTLPEAAEMLSSQNEIELIFLGGEKEESFCKINLNSYNETFVLSVTKDFMRRKEFQQKAIDLLKALTDVLPRFAFGQISADVIYEPNLGDVKPPLPFELGRNLKWFQIFAADVYEDYFSREDLLKTPAYDVELLENNNIALTVFPDSFGFMSYGSREYLRSTVKYLNSVIRK